MDSELFAQRNNPIVNMKKINPVEISGYDFDGLKRTCNIKFNPDGVSMVTGL